MPPEETPLPRQLRADGDALLIDWNDGATHRLPWRMLRENCPCATCRTRREKPAAPPDALPVLSAAEAQPVKAASVQPVGNYAYAIAFNDGHNTGIYSLELLRQLGEAAS